MSSPHRASSQASPRSRHAAPGFAVERNRVRPASFKCRDAGPYGHQVRLKRGPVELGLLEKPGVGDRPGDVT